MKSIAKHFVALSTNAKAVAAFGIDTANMFEFWNWVGGRYSLWSAIGFPSRSASASTTTKQLPRGRLRDGLPFPDRSGRKNIPVILGLVGFWYNNFGRPVRRDAPVRSGTCNRFAAYFQQADMESNGKTVDRDGNRVDYQTGPIPLG